MGCYINRDRELFDNSDYSKYSKFYLGENKKVIGKFKDEAAGHPITEFVGLKSKMYSYEIDDGKDHGCLPFFFFLFFI